MCSCTALHPYGAACACDCHAPMTAPTGPEPEERAALTLERATDNPQWPDMAYGWIHHGDNHKSVWLAIPPAFMAALEAHFGQVSALQADVAAVTKDRDEARATVRRVHAAIRNGAVSAGEIALAMCKVDQGEGPSILDDLAEARADVARLEGERDRSRRTAEQMEGERDEARAHVERLKLAHLEALSGLYAERDEVKQLAHELGLTVAERDEARADLAANERSEDARLTIAEAELAAVLPLRKAAAIWRAQFSKPTKLPRVDALIAAVDELPALLPGTPTYAQLLESHARLLDERDEWTRTIAEMGAENEAMRPVVEAAKAWRHGPKNVAGARRPRLARRLTAAVDQMGEQTAASIADRVKAPARVAPRADERRWQVYDGKRWVDAVGLMLPDVLADRIGVTGPDVEAATEASDG